MTQTKPAREPPAIAAPPIIEPPPSDATSPEGTPAKPAAHFPGRGQTWTYTDEPVFKLSVEAYHELIRAGRLTSDDKVELIEGVLVHRMSKNPPHEFCKSQVIAGFNRLLPPGWFCRSEAPISLLDSEPEPDVSVVRGTTRDYVERHPAPADVGLVVEIADSTLRRDRGPKQRAYARAGVAVYWIINVTTREIEVHTDPQPAAEPPVYAESRHYTGGEAVPVWLDGTMIGEVAVSDVLP